ncbi:hypothetical protein LINPERPRIM_LOCUS41314 [Linum perenne]
MTRSRSSPAEASPVEGRFSRGRRCWKTLRLQSCKQYGVDWTSWWKVNARTFSSVGNDAGAREKVLIAAS